MNTSTTHCGRFRRGLTRRELLQRAGGGFGGLALADLLAGQGLMAAAPVDPMSPKSPHYSPKVKSIIWLFMEGAPSAVDLFDPKPELTKRHGTKFAIDTFNGKPGPLMKSPFSFKQYGQSGAWVCDQYPNVARHVDDIAFIKSCYT